MKDINSIVSTLEKEAASMISSLIHNDTQFSSPVQMMDDCMGRIRKIDREEMVDSLTRHLRDPGLSPEDRKDILMRIQELMK